MLSDVFNRELDTRGLDCPLPILRLKQALKGMESGQVVKMIATDPGSQSDVPAFSAQTGHRLLKAIVEADVFIFFVQKL